MDQNVESYQALHRGLLSTAAGDVLTEADGEQLATAPFLRASYVLKQQSATRDPVGTVFIDIFRDGHKVYQHPKNVAMVYVVSIDHLLLNVLDLYILCYYPDIL